MAKSLTKVVLFATSRHDKKVYQHPVASFNSEATAKSYAMILRLAHRSGDVVMAKELDPRVQLTGDGELIADTKWSMVTLPYEPEPSVDDDETESETPSAS